jgi:hypothetical protein
VAIGSHQCGKYVSIATDADVEAGDMVLSAQSNWTSQWVNSQR